MKPFDLDKALAGEPVVLRNGLKAYIKHNLEDYQELDFDFPLRGYLISEGYAFERSWTIDGLSFLAESEYDVIGMWEELGMWEEPRPAVTRPLPATLKEPQEEMWIITSSFEVRKSNYKPEEIFKSGRYFATREDAQACLDAICASSM